MKFNGKAFLAMVKNFMSFVYPSSPAKINFDAAKAITKYHIEMHAFA